MAVYASDGVELRLPTHLDLPCSDDEVMPPWTFRVPDHTDLPDSDGEVVENVIELPQASLLSDSIRPVLDRIHPDAYYLVAGNSAIYWDFTDPPLSGAIGPDWFYVPDVHPLVVNGLERRSYVMWMEAVLPSIVMEFVSGNGAKERDRTPRTGKFWIYEHGVKATYYAIFEPTTGQIELYQRRDGRLQWMPANTRGHYPVAGLSVELGVWHGRMMSMERLWLRWFDDQGVLLPTSGERAESEGRRADRESLAAEESARRADREARVADEYARRADEQARIARVEARRADEQSHRADEQSRRADEQAQLAQEQFRIAQEELRRADALAAKLRALGVDPDEVAGSA